MRQALVGGPILGQRTPPVPGYRGHPPRLCLARVEHGNPDGVRNMLMRGRCADREGSGSPSGHRMAQEAKAGSRKAAGNREIVVGSSADLLG